ncbi:hypothetical protein ALP83_200052 [Pseudomonas syringae pv. actinidiae]|nr:hypothetical protein ALP83_200052 [Pseudomonas syringae pv. actinidiae]
MTRIERSKVQDASGCAPKMNPETTAEEWYSKAENSGGKFLAPQRKLANEKPKGETIAYSDLLKSWEAGKK